MAIVAWENQELTHFEYLHLENTDPREAIAKALANGFGEKGSVLSYYASVEKGILKGLAESEKRILTELAESEKRILTELAESVPKYAKKLLAIVDRIVDRYTVFKNNVYDPEFFGSFSIKTVAPVLLGSAFDYDRLKVGGGMESRAIADKIMRGAEAGTLKDDLLAYCRQDTIAMVELFKWLVAQ